MSEKILIIVEGIADQKFIIDYIQYKYPNFLKDEFEIINTGGKDRLFDVDKINKLKKNTDADGENIVIYDSDNDYNTRKQEIETEKKDNNVNFKLFLFPNNKESGALETLLESITPLKNRPVFECWDKFTGCLKQLDSREILDVKLHFPNNKSKLFSYLDVFSNHIENKNDGIKDDKRNYQNKNLWNLDSEYLKPLNDFLDGFFSTDSQK